jgi:hypothetical protein
MAGVIVKDAMNPEGITRKFVHTVKNRFVSHLKKSQTGDQIRKVRTVEAEVLPESGKSK